MVNPALMMLAVLGLFVWMLIRIHDTAPLKIFGLIAVLMLFGPIADRVMNAEAAAFQWKFDYSLFWIDKTLGLSAFAIARHLSKREQDAVFFIYLTLGQWMIVWYGCNLKMRFGRPRPLLISYLVTYGLGPLFYMIVPAYGPRHAFGALFPFGDPQVSLSLVRLQGWPNAIPSLHLATAVLFVYFSGRSRWLKVLAWFLLAATAAATLAFEHYFIDLVVGVPYAFFAIRVGEARWQSAFRHLAIVLAWLLSIRFETPLLIASPFFLRLAVCATLTGGIVALLDQRDGPRVVAPKRPGPAPESDLLLRCEG